MIESEYYSNYYGPNLTKCTLNNEDVTLLVKEKYGLNNWHGKLWTFKEVFGDNCISKKLLLFNEVLGVERDNS